MPSSLFPLGGAFRIDGVHSDTWHMYLRSWAHQHTPTPRLNLVGVPGKVGKFAQQTELDSKLLSFDIACANLTGGRQGMMADFRNFAAALDPRTGGHQMLLEDDNPGWVINVQPSSQSGAQANIQVQQTATGIAYFTMMLEAADPWWYSTTPRSISWQPRSASNKTLVVTNNGNGETPPVFTITYPTGGSGVLTGLKIAYNGSSVTYNGTIGSSDTVVIDCGNWTITKNGVIDITNWGQDGFPMIQGTTDGLAPNTPPRTSPVTTTMTWTDTNNIGANVTVAYTERSL